MSKLSLDCRRWREAIRLSVCETVAGEQSSGIQSHLATCPDCRRYAEELRAATAGLRWLGSQDVEPRPGFRARWTRAVEKVARPSSFGETAGALAAWGRGLLQRNLRPGVAIASLWVLALVFRLSAPAVSTSTQTIVARSPVELFRMLEVHTQLLARQVGRQSPAPVEPHSVRPRSEGPPSQPSAHWHHEPGVNFAARELFPHPIAYANTSALLPV